MLFGSKHHIAVLIRIKRSSILEEKYFEFCLPFVKGSQGSVMSCFFLGWNLKKCSYAGEGVAACLSEVWLSLSLMIGLSRSE